MLFCLLCGYSCFSRDGGGVGGGAKGKTHLDVPEVDAGARLQLHRRLVSVFVGALRDDLSEEMKGLCHETVQFCCGPGDVNMRRR
jgi:hypothetical protein